MTLTALVGQAAEPSIAMPRARVPFPTEDAPGYDASNPYADKVALTDHRHYMLGQYFIQEARVRVRFAIAA